MKIFFLVLAIAVARTSAEAVAEKAKEVTEVIQSKDKESLPTVSLQSQATNSENLSKDVSKEAGSSERQLYNRYTISLPGGAGPAKVKKSVKFGRVPRKNQDEDEEDPLKVYGLSYVGFAYQDNPDTLWCLDAQSQSSIQSRCNRDEEKFSVYYLGNCYNVYSYDNNVCGSKMVVQNIDEELDDENRICQEREEDEEGRPEESPQISALIFDNLCPTITKSEWISKITLEEDVEAWNDEETRDDMCYYLDVFEETSSGNSKIQTVKTLNDMCDKDAEEAPFTENDLNALDAFLEEESRPPKGMPDYFGCFDSFAKGSINDLLDAKIDFLIYVNDMCFEVDFEEDGDFELKAISGEAFNYKELCVDKDFSEMVEETYYSYVAKGDCPTRSLQDALNNLDKAKMSNMEQDQLKLFVADSGFYLSAYEYFNSIQAKGIIEEEEEERRRKLHGLSHAKQAVNGSSQPTTAVGGQRKALKARRPIFKRSFKRPMFRSHKHFLKQRILSEVLKKAVPKTTGPSKHSI